VTKEKKTFANDAKQKTKASSNKRPGPRGGFGDGVTRTRKRNTFASFGDKKEG